MDKTKLVDYKIPFNKPSLGQREIEAITEVIKSGKIAGNGPIGKRTEVFMREFFESEFVLLTTSCTHALEMALMALNINRNDEVILPSFSFVSAANAIARIGAKPIFVDVRDEDFNIDPSRIKKAITSKTKAIICVHYAGLACMMEEILEIAGSHGIAVVEDAAQAVGSKRAGRFLGTFGDIGCFSFHETKNFTCGEGGAFLTKDPAIARRAEIIRENGTNRAQFLRGAVDKYTWVGLGSSYVLSDILSAVLEVQLHNIEHIIAERKQIGTGYIKGLEDLEGEGKIILPKFGVDDNFNWHIFYFRVRDEETRNGLLLELRQKGIEATFHFVPLHTSPYARKTYGYRKNDFPVSEKAGATLIRLPIYPGLKKEEQDYIVASIHSILKKQAAI